MKFAIIVALASSVYGASCLNDDVVRTKGSPGFMSAKLEQVSNAPPSFPVSTSGIVGTISTGIDNCKFYLSGLKFQINVKDNKDPKLRWSGMVPGTDYGVPIQEGYMPSNLKPNGAGFSQVFDETYEIEFTRNGAFVGGIAYTDFYEVLLFSDEYQWPIAKAAFGANKKPINTGPTNPGTANPGQGTLGGNQSGSFNNAPLTVVMATVMVIAVCAQFF